jgi:hypothetical protein
MPGPARGFLEFVTLQPGFPHFGVPISIVLDPAVFEIRQKLFDRSTLIFMPNFSSPVSTQTDLEFFLTIFQFKVFQENS